MEKNLASKALAIAIQEGARGSGPGNGADIWTYPVGLKALIYEAGSEKALFIITTPNLDWKIESSIVHTALRHSLFGIFIEMLNVFVYIELINGMIAKSKDLDDLESVVVLSTLLKDFINADGLLPIKGYQLLLQRITNDYKRHGAIFPSEAFYDIALPVSELVRFYLPTPELIARGYQLTLDVAPNANEKTSIDNIATCGFLKPMRVTTYRERVDGSIAAFDKWFNRASTAANLIFSPQYRQLTLRQRNTLIASGDLGQISTVGTSDGRELLRFIYQRGGEKMTISPYVLLTTAVTVGFLKQEHTRKDWFRIYKIDVIALLKPVKESIHAIIEQIHYENNEYLQLYHQLNKQRADQLVDTAIIRSMSNLKGKNQVFGTILTRRARNFKYPIIDVEIKKKKKSRAGKVTAIVESKRLIKMQLAERRLHMDKLYNLGLKIMEDLKVEEMSDETFSDLFLLNETLGIAADVTNYEKSNIAELAMEMPEVPAEELGAIGEMEARADDEGSIFMPVDIQQMSEMSIPPQKEEEKFTIAVPEIESGIVASAIAMPMEGQAALEQPIPETTEKDLGLDAPIELVYIPFGDEEAKEEKKEIVMTQIKKADKNIVAELKEIAVEAKKADEPKIINSAIQEPKAVDYAIKNMAIPDLLEVKAALDVVVVDKPALIQAVDRRIEEEKIKITARLDEEEKTRERNARSIREKEFKIIESDLKGKRNIISDIKAKKAAAKALSTLEKKWIYFDNMMRITYNKDIRTSKKTLLSTLMQRRLSIIINEDNRRDPEMYKIPEMGQWADIRALAKGTIMYELVEFPRINILHMDDKHADVICATLGEVIMKEFMPLVDEHVVEFVYYATDGYDNKIGNGGFISVKIGAQDTLEIIKQKIQETLHGLCESAMYDTTINGSGNVEINLILADDQRKHNAQGEIVSADRANVFIQYMRLQRPMKDIAKQMPIKAFASTLIKPFNAVRSLIKFSTKTNISVCIFEAFKIIIENGYMGKQKIESNALWEEYIAASLLNEHPNYVGVCQDGDIKEFLHRVLLETKRNIGLFNYYTNELWAPDFSRACENNIMLYYANHVHVTNVEILLEHFSLRDKYDGSNLYVLLKKNQFHKKKLKYKEYELNSMVHRQFKEEQKERKKPEKKIIKHVHWGLDYETRTISLDGKQQPYLLVVSKVALDNEDQEKTEKYVFWGENCTLDFIFKVINPILEKKENLIQHHFWTYNGANFDFHFLIGALQRLYAVKILGSSTSFKTLRIGKNISFLDLACWYSMPYNKDLECNGLRALAKICKTKHQKGDFHHDVKEQDLHDKDFMAKAEKYCLLDVYVLNDLINALVIGLYEKFNFMGRKACVENAKFYPHSAASLALTIYKNCFIGPLTNLTPSKNKIYQLERESYHGGITLPFKTMATLVKCFDINSSYPHVMLTHEMPYKYVNTEYYPHGFIFDKNKTLIFNNYDLIEYWAFEFPKDTFLPCLMIKAPTGSLIQVLKHVPTSGKTMCSWGYEIRMALRQGANISVKARHIYEGKNIFSHYVKHFYAAKKEAKKTGNIAEELFNKNLLNSLQGKLGEKERENKIIGQLHIIANGIFTRGTENLKTVEYLSSGTYRATWKLEKDEELSKIGSLVRFPSYIAAAARINLIAAMLSVPSKYIVYCDTDSIFLSDNQTLPKEFLSDDALGMFKEEKDKESDIMLCFGAKNYVLLRGTKAQLKCKGIRSQTDISTYATKLLKDESVINEIKPFFKKNYGEIYVTKTERTIRNTMCFKRANWHCNNTTAFKDLDEYLLSYGQNLTAKKAKKMPIEETKKRKYERETMLSMLSAVAYETERNGHLDTLENILNDFDFGLQGISEKIKIKEAINLYMKDTALKKELLLAINANSPELILKLKNNILDIHRELDQTIEEVIKQGKEKDDKEQKEHEEMLDYLLK